MNLVTAVVVENALSLTKQDEEHRIYELKLLKEKELQKLADMFATLDLDGSGEINEEEFRVAMRDNPDLIDKFKLLGFDEKNWERLFSDLDDGDGTLTLDEFAEGLKLMAG